MKIVLMLPVIPVALHHFKATALSQTRPNLHLVGTKLSHMLRLKDWRDSKEWHLRGWQIVDRCHYAIVGLDSDNTIYAYIGETKTIKKRRRQHITQAIRYMNGNDAGEFASRWIAELWNNGAFPLFLEIKEQAQIMINKRHWPKTMTGVIAFPDVKRKRGDKFIIHQ